MFGSSSKFCALCGLGPVRAGRGAFGAGDDPRAVLPGIGADKGCNDLAARDSVAIGIDKLSAHCRGIGHDDLQA